MNYPKIRFVNSKGQAFPRDEDGIPYVRQFKGKWAIQLEGDWAGGVALEGNTLFLLERHYKSNLWEVHQALSGDVVRRSGEITALLTDQFGKAVKDAPKATLRIQPANITDQQMDCMVSDIGIMALTTACCVKRAVPTALGEGIGIDGLGQHWAAGSGMLATATALLELAAVVQDTWVALEKRPLKSFIIEPGPVDISQTTLSPQLLIQKVINPGKRRILGIKRSESANCPENEFLCYILDYYLKDLAKGLADSLNSLVLEDVDDKLIPKKWKRDDDIFLDFIDDAQQRVRKINLQISALRQQVKTVLEKLLTCVVWAEQARNFSFLAEVETPHTPNLTSLRLTESPTYGPIYSKYLNVVGEALEPIQKVLHLVEHIYKTEVRPSWEIYEIWCLVKLYSGFILYSPLRPFSNKPNLFESIEVTEEGTIQLPKEKEFALLGKMSSGTSAEVRLIYEPKLYNQKGQLRTPDIVLTVKVGRSEKKYCFDAKYRNYKQQKTKTVIQDIIDVARDKYWEGLSTAASFILHTDAEIDYWGEVPFHRFLDEKFATDIDELEYPGHKYGAISFVPQHNADAQLKRILRLLLQYHDHQLSTACLACGYQLTLGQDAHTTWMPDRLSEITLINRVISESEESGKGTGVYCSCPKCGEFWVIQSCYGSHHRLLKFKDCFHRKSDHPEFQSKWMYICPVCGSDPSLEDL